MEKGVNTSSFIPKRPVGKGANTGYRRTATTRWFVFVGWLIFIATIAGVGGVYLYHKAEAQNVSNLLTELKQKQDTINTQNIPALARFSSKLDASKLLLSQHIAFSKFFTFLEKNTVRSLKFTDFEFKGKPGSSYSMTLDGEARDYAAIGLQSDMFKQNNDLSNVSYSHVGLSKNKENVLFTVGMAVSPSAIRYTGDAINQLSLNTLTP